MILNGPWTVNAPGWTRALRTQFGHWKLGSIRNTWYRPIPDSVNNHAVVDYLHTCIKPLAAWCVGELGESLSSIH